jgi:hypothetical protein
MNRTIHRCPKCLKVFAAKCALKTHIENVGILHCILHQNGKDLTREELVNMYRSGNLINEDNDEEVLRTDLINTNLINSITEKANLKIEKANLKLDKKMDDRIQKMESSFCKALDAIKNSITKADKNFEQCLKKIEKLKEIEVKNNQKEIENETLAIKHVFSLEQKQMKIVSDITNLELKWIDNKKQSESGYVKIISKINEDYRKEVYDLGKKYQQMFSEMKIKLESPIDAGGDGFCLDGVKFFSNTYPDQMLRDWTKKSGRKLGIRKAIEYVFFDHDSVENNNLKYSNWQKPLVMIYDKNGWEAFPVATIVDEFFLALDYDPNESKSYKKKIKTEIRKEIYLASQNFYNS